MSSLYVPALMRIIVGFVAVPVAAALIAAWTVLNFAVPSDETTKVPERLLTSGTEFEKAVRIWSPALLVLTKTRTKRNVEIPILQGSKVLAIRQITYISNFAPCRNGATREIISQ